MKLKNCIKIRVPSNDGWKDVRCEYYKDHDCFYGLTDYDEKVLFQSGIDELVDSGEFKNAIKCSADNFYEVTWQSDEWPQ